MGQGEKQVWGAPPRRWPGFRPQRDAARPALLSRLRHHGLVGGRHVAADPRTWAWSCPPTQGPSENRVPVMPSCPLNRVTCGKWPCSGKGWVVERVFKTLEERNSKSWADFQLSPFPMGHVTSPPHPLGLRTRAGPAALHPSAAARAALPRPGEHARRLRLPGGMRRRWHAEARSRVLLATQPRACLRQHPPHKAG